MTLSLHAATVPTYLQILGSVAGLIDKAEQFCTETGTAPEELIGARLAADMLPFAYQVKSTVVHSLGAIEGVRRGVFSPDTSEPPATFAALRDRVTTTISALKAIDPSEMEGFIGRPMRFETSKFGLDFTADQFLLSFSQPNFQFHATTAYAILRMKGVKIGKIDYLGQMRVVG